jgi:hypothetical protein
MIYLGLVQSMGGMVFPNKAVHPGKTVHPSKAIAAISVFAALMGCQDKSKGTPGGAGGVGGMGGMGGGDVSFQPLAPSVSGSKIKTVLVGQALTDEEVKQLTGDPHALASLIDSWIALPQWQTRMLDFFKQAFQQTQTSIADYDDQIGHPTMPWNAVEQTRFVRSAEESFARTALQLIAEGRPFTEVLTTRRFMLNPPLMSALAFMDATPLGDDNKPINAALWLVRKYPGFTFTRQTTTPVPLTDSIDPASPNFMVWYDPNPYAGANAACVEPQIATGARAMTLVSDFLFGGRTGCGSTTSQFSPDDWANWRMVEVRPPASASEVRTTFWDIPMLRTTATLVLNTPRVGFMTTPAFFANWPTNASNQARVTTNQTMIVGLGTSFDDRGTTVQISETSSDAMHVQPNTPCYGCHSTLDPMRDFFRQSYNYYYFQQLAAGPAGVPATGTFTVSGSAPVMGSGIANLAEAMASHPRFAIAWTQKLCRLANSSSCSEDDPEFLRVVQVFRDSSFNFKTLVRELYSSPVVTFASRTKTSDDGGVTVGISRREALCAALQNRLGLADVCGLDTFIPARNLNAVQARMLVARNLAMAVPGDGYSRGAETPLMPHDPNLFFSSTIENLCGLIAAQVVDAPAATSRFSSADKDSAVADLTRTVMGLPASDSRNLPLTGVLGEHFDAAIAAGETRTDALRSTFVLACSSPLTVSSGL